MNTSVNTSVDIVIEDARWDALDLQALAERAFSTSMTYLDLPGFGCCVMACDDGRIATLNAEFRGKPTPTNVLSWPSEDRSAEAEGDRPEPPDAAFDPELGDIAISYDTCAREASEAGKSMKDHVTHLLVHGILHLLGYDHVLEGDADLMESTEVHILAQMGLSDPYLV